MYLSQSDFHKYIRFLLMDSMVYHSFFSFTSIDPFLSQLWFIVWKSENSRFCFLSDYGYDSHMRHNLMASRLC